MSMTPPPATTLIKADNITVRRARQTLIRDVSLTVNAHDFITVVGPNGAGKSTLLKCLMGFFRPDQGRVQSRAGLTIGYVPQHLALNTVMPLSARRFLSLGRRDTQQRMEETVRVTGSEGVLDAPMHTLSGGQLQRLLLARALLGNPSLLVLDEPTQNLDVAGQLRFYQLLEQIYRERRISILMVSHELHFVMRCTQQVVCLYHHVCCSGKPQDIAQDPQFVALFGDDMAQLLSLYHHPHNHHHHAG